MGFLSDLIGGIFGNEAADKQADAMVNAQKAANQTTMDMFNRSTQIQTPNIQAGWNALGVQGNLLGIPNLVPQESIQAAQDALNPSAKWQAYMQQYGPEIQAFWNRNQKAFKKLGSDWTKAAERYYNQVGIAKGHTMPTAYPQAAGGATGGTGTGSGAVGVGGGAYMPGGSSDPMVQAGGTAGTGGSATDNAYNAFLDSGFNRAMTDFTNNDLDMLKANYATAGKSLSGSAVGAMGDRLARNRYNAFGDYYGALSGISGTGAQLGSQQAAATNQVGSQLAAGQQNIGNIRASSYGVQGDNKANMLNAGMNAFATYFGGK